MYTSGMAKIAAKTVFKTILLTSGWAKNIAVEVDDGGIISNISVGETGGIDGISIPGIANAHSHAFQRAFAGKTEKRGKDGDDFWAWRKVMYSALKDVGPEELRAIAAQLYVEMLKSGYTGVAEFHYLHHQADGTPYENRTAMSDALITAATDTGIDFTLLPVLYMRGDFGEAGVDDDQRPFTNSPDDYSALLQMLQGKCQIGVALHSLRAVPEEIVREINSVSAGGPIHIHIAEQVREVNHCFETHGKRPVEWLLENADVNAAWNLVHATHINADEVAGIAESGATVVLCPTTEANLGDGIFPLENFLKAGGRYAIGSDSHVSVDPREELRLLEYGQRLTLKRRAIAGENPGATLWQGALGAAAMGDALDGIQVGARANIVVLDENSPAIAGCKGDEFLDALVFAGQPSPVRDVMAGGVWRVKDYHHPGEDAIKAAYLSTFNKL